MYESILQFATVGIKEIEKNVEKLICGEIDLADLSKDIEKRVLALGNQMVCEYIEAIDQEIFESGIRKKSWYVEHKDEVREIVDVMGTLRFKRRGYVPKSGGEHIYLMDKLLGLDGHQKLTLGAAARVMEEAIKTSYAKGGKAVNSTDTICKETVKEWLHKTEIEMPLKEVTPRKKLRFLHIVADEDHVAAQFWEKKGDLEVSASGNKINTIMSKIVVVYEDVIDEAPEGSKKHRYKLVGKRTFSGVYSGENENYKLWKEVADYIEANYDTDYLNRVYIEGDGAAWIKAGVDVIENSCFALDRFHIMKYVNTSVAHLENGDDIKSYIWDYINDADQKGLKALYKEILDVTENPNKYEDVEGALKYFLNNWDGIVIRKTESSGVWGCCAEGQVSHVLSARMSSRPMGWSVLGCDHMSKLRAYTRNGGKVIDLLRYQNSEREKRIRRQEQKELIKDLRKRKNGWNYAEKVRGEIPGIEAPSMRWIRDLINSQLNA